MITFTICLLALIAGYFIYGRLVERVFGPDDRKTPALTHADGVDYIPLPTWKIFMIQFLNIAGLGPIFGAIMGAKFGTASYLWIVLGSIFAGATHDYFAGMLSLRNGGESLPEIVGRFLGMTTKQVMRGFTVVLMILVGAVFVAGPAGLLAKKAKEFQSAITLEKDGKSVNLTKLMAVMGLGIKQGETITVTVEGEDETVAAEEIAAFLNENV